MASRRLPSFFTLGFFLGALGWHLAARNATALATAGASADGAARPAPVAVSPTGGPQADEADAPAEAALPRAAKTQAAAENGLRLWEALALRGAPSGGAAGWIKPPNLSAPHGGFGTASPDAPISPEFVEFFDLTPGEQDRLQALLRATLQAQHEMDVARIRPVESRFRIKQAIEIPAYAETSAALRESYESGLRAILGDARFQVYRDWAGDAFRQDFPGLAGMNRQYHFIPAKDPAQAYVQVVAVAYPAGVEWTGAHSTYVFKSLAEAEERAGLPLSLHFTDTAQSTEAPR